MIHSAPKSPMTTLLQFVVLSTVCFILTAVLYPEFVGLQDRASAHAQSNMLALGRAFAQYENDYDGTLPPGSQPNIVNQKHSLNGVGWAGELYPYVTNASSFDDGLGHTLPDPSLGSIVSYAYNRNAARQYRVATWTAPRKTVLLFQVTGAHCFVNQPDERSSSPTGQRSPAGDGTFIMLMDNTWPRLSSPGTGSVGSRPPDSPHGQWPMTEVDGGSFYLFGDGHVEWMKPSDVSSGITATSPASTQTGDATGFAAGTSDPAYFGTFSTN